jgi:hypothetical protein
VCGGEACVDELGMTCCPVASPATCTAHALPSLSNHQPYYPLCFRNWIDMRRCHKHCRLSTHPPTHPLYLIYPHHHHTHMQVYLPGMRSKAHNTTHNSCIVGV